MKRVIKKITLRIVSLFMVLVLLLPFFRVSANYSNNIEEAPVSQTTNAYKIWSVCKALGMNDYAAAGMLGNIFAESSGDPTSIEGISGEYSNPEGTKKSKAIQDLSAYFRNELVQKYINSGWNISGSSDSKGNVVPDYSGGWKGHSLNTSAYLGIDGEYTVGIGLIQFTGARASRLLLWSKSHNVKWYDMKTQLAYMLTTTDENGYLEGKADYIINTYAKREYTSVDDATNDFMLNVEGNNHNASGRRSLAMDWYNRFHGDSGDRKYGTKVLALANAKGVAVGEHEIEDRSIEQELISPVLKMERNSGFMFDVGHEGERHATQASTEIYNSLKGEESKNKYSLYELFGSDVHFYRYFGEQTQTIGLLDHIYSNLKDGNKEFSVGDTVFYQGTRYLSANVYDDRPRVLTQQEITDGKSDARVFALSNSRFIGYSFVAGEFWMYIAKFMTGITTFLMGNSPMKAVVEIFNFFANETIWDKVFKPLLYVLTGYAMVFTIIRVVGHTMNYLAGRGTLFQIFQRVLSSILCIAVIFGLGSNPKAFSDIVLRTTTIVDTVFDHAVNLAYQEDDVIGSTLATKATEASIWKTTIFNPWIVGQFGTTYDNLYTQFSDKGAKMKQSHATEAEIASLDEGEFTFDSASKTGDVSVPVGNRQYIKNWGAYLYSVQSKYHIDHKDITGSRELVETPSFPNATTTAYDSSINADTFRIIDATMNIAPQIYSDKTEVENYTDSKIPETHFLSQSLLMVLYSVILMVFFIPTILKKIYAFFMLITFGVQFIGLSLYDLAKENKGFSLAWDKVKQYLSDYILATTRLFVFTILFTKLVGQSFISTTVFVFLGIVIYQITPNKIREKAFDISNNIQIAKNYLKRH